MKKISKGSLKVDRRLLDFLNNESTTDNDPRILPQGLENLGNIGIQIQTIINKYRKKKNRYPLILTFDIAKKLSTGGEDEECLETVAGLYKYIGAIMGKSNDGTSDNCYNEKLLGDCMGTIIVRLKKKHKEEIKSKNDNHIKEMGGNGNNFLIYPFINVDTFSFKNIRKGKETILERRLSDEGENNKNVMKRNM